MKKVSVGFVGRNKIMYGNIFFFLIRIGSCVMFHNETTEDS